MSGETENPKVLRRLAAILAADIAGYSALMGADEAGTVRDLKGHQTVILPMVSEHSGRIVDTAGDGILAEFPSVVNAVECALAIQRAMAERNATIAPDRRMQFRIGVNLGDVIHDEARVYGDGVNIAARLEGRLPRITPCRAIFFINRATVQRAIVCPSRSICRHTLRTP